MNSSTDITATVVRSPRTRSRVTNAPDLMAGVDMRSAIGRRYKDLTSQMVADQGGRDRCSEARLQLIRRFAACAVLAEVLEGKLATGAAIDVAEHALLSSTLVRLASRIGIDRRAKTIVPDLRDYLEGRAG
jgi:hypothetical protein